MSLIVWTVLSASLSVWMPLQFSIATVFLFAGPHNWLELRYFLTRLPVRFGRSRLFFLTAFIGLGLLTTSYISLPLLYRSQSWSEEQSITVIAVWNSLLLVWIGYLIRLRSEQKRKDWGWTIAALLALGAFNWIQPDGFSLGLVYLHPLIALWFLDLHLRKTRPAFLKFYRGLLIALPLILGLMIFQTAGAESLNDNNGLFWRVTQHSGAQLLPQVSSHLLVSIHVFLEMLHYGVWILALPLVRPLVRSNEGGDTNRYANTWKIGVYSHPRGFPKTVLGVLFVAMLLVIGLWAGFAYDYATARDIYFTLAIAHVLAEAPFLLRMI
ncbi:MAG TPA: hypothetical protein VLB68_18235 [Pyrinomonadaceae bacterium]|nr:hypothetical protein [Pyrinomonadaceae bacterium]